MEKEIERLWKKVVVYEKYSDDDRNLRIRAVEALRSYEAQHFREVQDILIPPEEPKDEEAKSSRWGRPKVMMLRVKEQGTQRLRDEIEAGERRITDIERRGFELDQEHRRSIAESQAQQCLQ